MQKAMRKQPHPPVGRWGAREAGIIQVASQLFSDNGYESVTMAAVAAACGLSEGTLYNYFRDKNDLALRVTLAAFDRYADEAEQIVANSASLQQGLEALIALELRILIEARGGMMRIWLREVRGAQSYPQSAARDVLRRFSSHLIALFQKWGVHPDPATGLNYTLMRDIVFGGAEHVVWTAIVQGRADRLDAATLARDLGAAYLRALGLPTTTKARKATAARPRRPAKRKAK